MTIQSSGSLSMSQINAEFGLGNSLSAYRGVKAWNSSGNLVTLPSTGLGFDDFYGLSYGDSAIEYQNIYTAGGSYTTSRTFTGCSFGAANPTRRIFVAAYSFFYDGVTGWTITGVTIGGVAATIHTVTRTTDTATGVAIALCSAKIPTGTSGSVVVTSNRNVLYNSVAVYRSVYLEDNSPTFAQHYALAGATNPATATVTVPAKGIVLAASGIYRWATRTQTWSGVTENYDNPLGSLNSNWSGGSFRSAAGGSRTVSATANSTDNVNRRFAILTWK